MPLPATNIHRVVQRAKAGWPDTAAQFGRPADRLLLLLVLMVLAFFPGDPINIGAHTTIKPPPLWVIRAMLGVLCVGTLYMHQLSYRHKSPY